LFGREKTLIIKSTPLGESFAVCGKSELPIKLKERDVETETWLYGLSQGSH
jgi:hypothetical protein